MLRYTLLLACVSFTTAYQLSVRAPSVRTPAARALRATPDDATPAEATPAAAPAEPIDDTPDAISEAKDALLQAIAETDRGFKKDKSMAASVRNAIHALSDAAKDLVEQLLNPDPFERLGSGPRGADDVRAHPFFEPVREWGAALRSREAPAPVSRTPRNSSSSDSSEYDCAT